MPEITPDQQFACSVLKALYAAKMDVKKRPSDDYNLTFRTYDPTDTERLMLIGLMKNFGCQTAFLISRNGDGRDEPQYLVSEEMMQLIAQHVNFPGSADIEKSK